MKKAALVIILVLLNAVFLSSCGESKVDDTLGADTSQTSSVDSSKSQDSASIQLENSKNSTITNYSTSVISTVGQEKTTVKIWQLGSKFRYESEGFATYIDSDKGEYIIVDLESNTGTKVSTNPSTEKGSYMNPFVLADSLSATLPYYTKTSSEKVGQNDCIAYEYKDTADNKSEKIYVSEKYKIIMKWEEYTNGTLSSSCEFSDFVVGNVAETDVTVPSSVQITDMNSLMSQS